MNTLKKNLQQREKIELIAIIQHMLRQEPDLQCLLVTSNRFLRPAHAPQSDSQIVIGLSVVRFDPQCPLVMRDCLLCSSRLFQRPSQAVVRFGMIRFGSRVELFLPQGTEIAAKVGDYAKGGETIIARRK